MSEWFGGVTMYPAAGCYQPAGEAIHCDPDVVMESSTIEGVPTPPAAESHAFLDRLARQVGRELGQETVFESVLTEDAAQWQPGHQQQFLSEPYVHAGAGPVSAADVFRVAMPLAD